MSEFDPANLTFSDDILEEALADHLPQETDVGATQNPNSTLHSEQSGNSHHPSILNEAFCDSSYEDSLYESVYIPRRKNYLDDSDEEEEEEPTVIYRMDGVDLETAAPSEETAAGIIANSVSSILLMSDTPFIRSTFNQLETSNHVAFGLKLEKRLNQAQKANLNRLLKTKMKSDVWMREEAERSQAFLRLYRLRRGENGHVFEEIPDDSQPS